MTEAAKHTPTPWRFVPWHIAGGPSEVRAPEGWLICTTSSDGNAEFIVKAVNAFEANARLIEALEGIVHFSDAVALRDDPLSKALRGWIEAGRTALAQARKGGE
jgi:hypothetical protein